MVNRISNYSKVLVQILLSLPLTASADVLEEPKLSSEFYAKLSVSVVKILAPAGGKLYAGSGVVVGKEEVLTNCHVVRRSQRITVMKGALRYPVDSQKVDIFKDLCLLKAPGLILPAVELRDPSELRVGNYAYFYGYPGGADAFFTEGRVSGLHPYEDSLVIKTTAGFSSGGSGGGLFDSRGRLIGITTFFSAGHSGSYYALPSDWLHNLRKRNAEEVDIISGLTLWEKDLAEQPVFLQFSQYMEDGNVQAALKLTSKWIKKEPKNFDSWLSYGKVLHGLGRNEEARRALEKALIYNPLDANALFTMANVLALVGDGANLKKVREALEMVDPQGVAEGKCNMAC
ncbi:trypsin-like peptidase domain-containing protein [Betaproteobacteria bacterium]|nr:trypsin-like peptidase domain-containing protein [Betaproteobacteria bacterium]